MSPAPRRSAPPPPLPDDGLGSLLPKLSAGIASSGTFVVLFFILYSRGVPPVDSFVLVLLGSCFMALLGYQVGKVLASAQPKTPTAPLPLQQTQQEASPIKSDDELGDLLDDDGEALFEEQPLENLTQTKS